MCRALLLVLLLLASCESYYRHYRYQPAPATLTFDRIFDVCLETARIEFLIDPSNIDRGLGTVTTRWKNDFTPMARTTRRRRAYFEVERLRAAKGDAKSPQFQVRYYVERQRYGEMASPMSPDEDDWKSDGQDQRLEQLLAAHLRLRLDQAARR